jgi:hypothetical protein
MFRKTTVAALFATVLSGAALAGQGASAVWTDAKGTTGSSIERIDVQNISNAPVCYVFQVMQDVPKLELVKDIEAYRVEHEIKQVEPGKTAAFKLSDRSLEKGAYMAVVVSRDCKLADGEVQPEFDDAMFSLVKKFEVR